MTANVPQLYLVVEAGPTAAARLSAILGAVRGIAAVLIKAGASPLDANIAKPLVELVQKADLAALVDGDAALARTVRADGVHLPWSPDLRARYDEAREILGTRFMIGAAIAPDAPSVRHDAMDIAEAGADYVGFSAGDGQLDLVAWWAEVFAIPCVAFDVASAEDAATFAEAGPEFIAATLAAGASPGDSVAHVAAIAAAIAHAAAGAA